MELIGKVHTTQRAYAQWDQMSTKERELQLRDMADSLIEPIKIFDHSALFVHPNPGDFNSVKRLLEIIREKTGDEYFLMMYGDTTLEIPNGSNMIDLSVRLFEDPEGLIKEQEQRMANAFECGPDAIHSIDPQGGMDLSVCKKLYGDKVAFIGNVNCGLLQTGTEEQVVADVRRSLKQGMTDGGGYVFSTSNCVYTGMDLERYKLIHKIWLEEGIYPEK